MGGSTTNACESFHRYFGDHFTRHSPNTFLFLEGLNAEQERTRLKIRSHSNPIKRKDQRQKEDKRRAVIGMLRGGEITMEEFVKKMGFLMLPVVMEICKYFVHSAFNHVLYIVKAFLMQPQYLQSAMYVTVPSP